MRLVRGLNVGVIAVQVIGVIRDRFLFKARPKPIISKPEASKNRGN